MISLYHQPGACSLASHILLEESNLPYETRFIDLSAGQQRSADYLAINPKGRIPALVHGDIVLTESPAILYYISGLAPEAGLMPTALLDKARVFEWTNWLAGSLHAVAFAKLIHPDWFADSADAQAEVRASGEKNVTEHFAAIDSRLQGREWAVGNNFSLVDPYLLVFYTWGRLFDMPMHDYRHYHDLALRLSARRAVAHAMADEGVASIT
jgi:glutathione S-transferase